MKKKGIYIGALFFLGCGMLFAQGEIDAYRFSQSDLNGTARSMSMGGAFGALGGDMSAMSHNPAGLGVYRSSEVQTTLNLNSANTESVWTGIKNSASQTRFGFDNFSYVGYFPTGNDQGIKGWNIGISYNKVKDFNRRYKAIGNPKSSMADYVASRASNAFSHYDNSGNPVFEGISLNDLSADNNPYDNNRLSGHWLPILGYNSYFFDPENNDNKNNDVYYSTFNRPPSETMLEVTEKGSVSEYNFSVATNISDILFFGATLGITDINYRMKSWHDESYGAKDYLYLGNSLETEGTGYSVNLGAIVRPINELRLGIAYNSPKWYKMTDYFYAEGETFVTGDDKPLGDNTPEGSYSEYSLRTPDRWIFSAAGVIGNVALISVDYELTNFKSMHLSDRDGNAYGDNDIIKEDFKVGQTLKLGAELKVTPQFAVRGGYIWQPSPMEASLKDGLVEVLPAGTIPHYTVSNTTNYYTAGLGYRFTPNFYMDVACIYRVQSEKLYPFSNVYWEDDLVKPVYSEPAKLSAKTTRLALTVGYKF